MVLVFDDIEAGGPEAGSAYALDESELGTRIETCANLKAGQIIELQSEDSTLRLRCRVVWTGDISSDQKGEAGLEFLLPRPI